MSICIDLHADLHTLHTVTISEPSSLLEFSLEQATRYHLEAELAVEVIASAFEEMFERKAFEEIILLSRAWSDRLEDRFAARPHLRERAQVTLDRVRRLALQRRAGLEAELELERDDELLLHRVAIELPSSLN